uniref:type II toxin-antitoxin system RelB/DinJ family antitoxin n=1 Tax=Terriglobus tenax TaxID=1111115 RepID=UPI0021DFE125
MAATALVQTRIDPAIKKRAAAVLKKQGITVSDAVRILLTRTANEGALPIPADTEAYDAWFRAKVHEALNDPRPDVSHSRAKASLARRKAALLNR